MLESVIYAVNKTKLPAQSSEHREAHTQSWLYSLSSYAYLLPLFFSFYLSHPVEYLLSNRVVVSFIVYIWRDWFQSFFFYYYLYCTNRTRCVATGIPPPPPACFRLVLVVVWGRQSLFFRTRSSPPDGGRLNYESFTTVLLSTTFCVNQKKTRGNTWRVVEHRDMLSFYCTAYRKRKRIRI